MVKATTKTTKKAPKLASKSVKVFNGSEYIREYSSKVHGKEYKKLAEQFANNNGYQLK